MTKILVIEDDDDIRNNIVEMLEIEGYESLGAPDGEVGLSMAVQHEPDLIICDIAMPGIDGYEVFEILSASPATAVIPFIFLSAKAERGDVRRGMDLGADDYISKPFKRVELLGSIEARLRRYRSDRPARSVQSIPSPPPDDLVLEDPGMKELFQQIGRFAKGAISILLLGETGVGKEVMAEQIHKLSERKGPFVAINCSAFSDSLIDAELFGHDKGAFTGAVGAKKGVFESAQGGTLFLDEVGDLPMSTQVKLLRALETRTITRVGGRSAIELDVRFVSATNRDIEAEVKEGRFRKDLYFRLNGVSLTVPALRDRVVEIAPLAARFIHVCCSAMERVDIPSLSPEVRERLEGYAWPGNIRELRNVIDRAVLLCDGETLLASHLPEFVRATPPETAPDSEADPRARWIAKLHEEEKQRVIAAMEECGHNQTKAAKLLGMSRRTLVTRLGEYNLPRPRKKQDKED